MKRHINGYYLIGNTTFQELYIFQSKESKYKLELEGYETFYSLVDAKLKALEILKYRKRKIDGNIKHIRTMRC